MIYCTICGEYYTQDLDKCPICYPEVEEGTIEGGEIECKNERRC